MPEIMLGGAHELQMLPYNLYNLGVHWVFFLPLAIYQPIKHEGNKVLHFILISLITLFDYSNYLLLTIFFNLFSSRSQEETRSRKES